MNSDNTRDTEQIFLQSSESAMTIRPHGAEAVAWTIGGRPVLWPGDAEWWPGSAPVLFPVCGATREDRVRHGEREVAMPLHGFARDGRFEVLDQAESSVTLRLTHSDLTLAHFPYPFSLRIRYVLTQSTLAQLLTVENSGDTPMPYSLGVHPGFMLPGGQGEILFDALEAPDIPVLEGRLFSSRRQPSGLVEHRLPLSPSLFERVGSLCFLNAASRTVTLTDEAGHGIKATFDGFPHIILWAPPGAPFVAVEGWTGHGDPVDYTGQFGDRPSTSWLAPGASASYSATFAAF